MKKLIILIIFVILNSNISFAASQAAYSAILGGFIYAIVGAVVVGICYYIFVGIFGFFKKAAINKSIDNSNKNTVSKNSTTSYQQNLNTQTDQKQTASEIDKYIHITPEEEEEIYAKVSREFSENKKNKMTKKK